VAVCALMIALARELGLSVQACREAGLAGLLHDVGKALMPLELLNKPGKLTDAEFDVIKGHPSAGRELLTEIGGFPPLVLDLVESHHERLDGRGYPDGLVDEQLPAIPRIIGVADTFDAMTTDRPYRKALTPEAAAEEIARLAGTQFCPQVAAAFGRLYARDAFTLEQGERLLLSLSALVPQA